MNIQEEMVKLDTELKGLYEQRRALRETFENNKPENYYKELWTLEEKMISIITDISRLERLNT